MTGILRGQRTALYVMAAILLGGVHLRWLYLISTPSDFLRYSDYGSDLLSDILASTLELTVGISAMVVTYSSVTRRSNNSLRASTSNLSLPTPTYNQSVALLTLGTGLHLAAFLILAQSLANIPNIVALLQNRTVATTDSQTTYRILLELAYVLCWVAIWGFCSIPNRRKACQGAIVAALVAALPFGLIGARLRSVTILLGMAFLLWSAGHIRLQQTNTKLVALFAGSLLTLVASAGGYTLRSSAQTGLSLSESAQAALAGGAAGSVTNGLQILDSYELAKRYALHHGFDFGQELLSSPLQLVPRGLWADKPVATGLKFREFFYGDSLGGIPPTAMGDGYLAGGIVGVIAVGMLIGLIAAILDSRRRSVGPSYELTFIVCVIAMANTGIRTGLGSGLILILQYSIFILAVRVALISLERRALKGKTPGTNWRLKFASRRPKYQMHPKVGSKTRGRL